MNLRLLGKLTGVIRVGSSAVLGGLVSSNRNHIAIIIMALILPPCSLIGLKLGYPFAQIDKHGIKLRIAWALLRIEYLECRLGGGDWLDFYAHIFKCVNPPNDQELSHAAHDSNREAELKAPTALAPVMC